LEFEPDADTLVKQQRSIGQKGGFMNFDGLVKSHLQATLSSFGKRLKLKSFPVRKIISFGPVRLSLALKIASCLRALARVLAI